MDWFAFAWMGFSVFRYFQVINSKYVMSNTATTIIAARTARGMVQVVREYEICRIVARL
jgi:hypothetical protein